ncbi:hypothetical protein NKR23_g1121 [Pleurostoma richardsiae]|uniref:Transcription factor domain-containing protein n=1 Tax=Pleurostoma richardsiae TaxID=41990 RepID=A0AA38VWR8_9PEZI|nr:hypothetical protein NKR23_g1121 [Pleurostoma richardsiae]
MQRRQTFPPFIHQHWHTATLPEQLATCMSISQLFVARTTETRPFLWRSIYGEAQRFRDELDTYSKYDIMVALQALVIYTIMAVVDQDIETLDRYARLTGTFRVMTMKLLQLLDGAPFAEHEWANPSAQWEDWIFAESRRRIGCLWFVVTRTVWPRGEEPCRGLIASRDKPLCTAKAMWEARTREEWETERAFHEVSLLHTDMWSFGALMDAHEGGGPLNAMRLDAWEAGTDKLGALMSIAICLVDKEQD